MWKKTVVLAFALVGICHADSIQDKMMAEMQAIMDDATNVTGYSFSVGYIDIDGRDFGLASGPLAPGGSSNATPTDTMLLGSGSKPFTAAGIMRLVDQGKLSLDDKAAKYIDKILTPLNSTTMVGLFGPLAADITVENVIKMQSGINDFDIPEFDNSVLKDGYHMHSIMEYLHVVGSFKAPMGCQTFNCTFVCKPGNCTCYSSTNFILAGLVLLGADPNPPAWYQLDQFASLGITRADYPHTNFLNYQEMSAHGLTVVGKSVQYGTVELFKQDASILGWTCGNVAAPARDTAKFYWELLSPRHTITSARSLAIMQQWSLLDFGWAKGDLAYGAGLMMQNVNPMHGRGPAPINDTSTYIGHGGDTYAFMSDNGFYPALNASISVIVNSDENFEYPTLVTCWIVKIAAKYLLPGKAGLIPCRTPKAPQYECRQMYGQKTCVIGFRGGSDLKTCEASCK